MNVLSLTGVLAADPVRRDTNKGVVRHSPGHTVHLHVRFTCTPGNSRCESY